MKFTCRILRSFVVEAANGNAEAERTAASLDSIASRLGAVTRQVQAGQFSSAADAIRALSPRPVATNGK